MLETNKIWPSIKAISLLVALAPFLSACGGSIFSKKSDINTTTKFSSAEYGVAASKRLTTSSNVPKGGGRAQIGKPYKIKGKWFTPKHEPNYDKTGVASWYGPNFHGRQTANGEIFDQYAISAAHPTLPLPSYVRVTNLENNKSIVVRVNDRGPFASGRIIDLSKRTADILGVIRNGTARVRVRYVGKAPLEGDDTRMLMASLNKASPMERGARFNKPRIQLAQAPIPIIRQNTSIATSQNHAGYSQTSQGFFIANSSTNEVLSPLFYASRNYDNKKGDNLINNAFAATNAMATRSFELTEWRNAIDQNARRINMELGVFADSDNANKVIRAFTIVGAVNEKPVKLRNAQAVQLTLTYLKLGVSRKDVIEIARELGLRDIILYD